MWRVNRVVDRGDAPNPKVCAPQPHNLKLADVVDEMNAGGHGRTYKYFIGPAVPYNEDPYAADFERAKPKRKRRVYVAGPMRGIPFFNFPAFDEAAGVLTALGYEVFNPAARDREVHGEKVNQSPTGDLRDIALSGFSLRAALEADTKWICQSADAICMLPGWEKSTGATAENALAKALGLKIGTLKDFVSWERETDA